MLNPLEQEIADTIRARELAEARLRLLQQERSKMEPVRERITTRRLLNGFGYELELVAVPRKA